MSPELFLQSVNLALSTGILIYAVRVEHRFTALETKMTLVLDLLRPMLRRAMDADHK